MSQSHEAAIVRRLYWTSFALRYSAGLLGWYLTVSGTVRIMEDATHYSQLAVGVSQDWLHGQQSEWLQNAMEGGRQAWFMVASLAVFYCFTGGVEILPFALGCYCLLTSFTPVLAYRAGRQLGSPIHGALMGARLVAYSPAFVIWSAALYKEGLILISLFLIAEYSIRLQRAFQFKSVVILCTSLVTMFGLRFYIAAIISVTLLASLTLGRESKSNAGGVPTLWRQVFIVILFLAFFSLIGIRERIEGLSSVPIAEHLEAINTSRQDLATSSSGYLQGTDVSNLDSAVEFLPLGMAYFLAVPFPWQIGSFRQNLAIPETLFWVVLVYPRAFTGLRRGLTRNLPGTAFLILTIVAICVLYALFIGNIGTAYRLRIQVWALFALLAGWGWDGERSRPTVGQPSPEAAVHAERSLTDLRLGRFGNASLGENPLFDDPAPCV